jgi:integrase/recombinase XerD
MVEIKFRFEINDKPNRLGLNEVFLVVTDSGKKQKIKTEVYTKNDSFGVFKDVLTAKGKKINKRVLTYGKWITNKDKEAAYKNNKLKNKIEEFKNAYDKTKEKDKYVNKESVIRSVENKYALIDVIAVFDRRLKELSNDYSNEKGYKTTKTHLLNFLRKENSSEVIDFRHIDRLFLQRFEKYLFETINGGDASDASVHAQMKRLRAIFNYAITEGVITPDVYPFRSYTLPTVTKKFKERLSVEELEQFETVKYEDGTALFHTQNIFLLAVKLAGTRIEDMLTMRVKNIASGRITFNMKKGNTNGKLKSFKITDKIKAILDHYVSQKSKPNDLIFPFLPPAIDTFSKPEYKKEIGRKTSLINKYLKLIADDACISKKITTHISRHSFASAALRKTKDIKALQEALGHSDPKITIEYLKELNIENLDEMMDSIDI